MIGVRATSFFVLERKRRAEVTRMQDQTHPAAEHFTNQGVDGGQAIVGIGEKPKAHQVVFQSSGWYSSLMRSWYSSRAVVTAYLSPSTSTSTARGLAL